MTASGHNRKNSQGVQRVSITPGSRHHCGHRIKSAIPNFYLDPAVAETKDADRIRSILSDAIAALARGKRVRRRLLHLTDIETTTELSQGVGPLHRAPFPIRRSGCSFIHELPMGLAETPTFQRQ